MLTRRLSLQSMRNRTSRFTHRHGRRNRIRHRKGNAILLLCIMLPVVLAVSAFAINVVYMELARTELQIATDVATRAAGRTLTVTGNQRAAVLAAERMLKLNPCGKSHVPLSATKIKFGVSTRYSEDERYQFTEGKINPNSVFCEGNGTYHVPMLFPTMGIPIDFRPLKSAICTQTEHDIALVLDRSSSMAFSESERSGLRRPASAPFLWTFGQPVPRNSRWSDAVDAVDEFIKFLGTTHQEERVSLSTFSTLALQDVPLTEDYNRVRQSLWLHSQLFLGGTNNISDGIYAGTLSLGNKQLARPWATRVMIVLTDSVGTSLVDPAVAARNAAAEHVLIYTVTFSDEADIEKMREVAAIGRGKHYHANTSSELVSAFKEIATRLPTLLTQ